MRAALVIAEKDLRQRFRDRSAFIIAFIAPLGLALIIAWAFGGGFSGVFDASFVVVDEDRSDLSAAFTEQVLEAPDLREQISVARASSPDEAHDLVRRDAVSAAFLIPEGFSEAVVSNRRAEITVLKNPDAEIGGEVAEALARAYADQINAGRLAVLTTIRSGEGTPDPAMVAELARQAAADRIPIELVEGEVGVRDVSGASYFGPAMAIFFLFFTTGFAARSLLAETEQGTLPRILASPVLRAGVIAGKALSGFAVGMASLAVMFVTFGLLLDVDWGDPVTLVVLSALTVLALMGLTAVIQSFAKTQQQADSYSSVAAVLLSLVGGSFFPLFQMPDTLQQISKVAPNAWALRAFVEIIYDGATLTDLGPHLAVIVGFAVVTGGIAVARARRLGLR